MLNSTENQFYSRITKARCLSCLQKGPKALHLLLLQMPFLPRTSFLQRAIQINLPIIFFFAVHKNESPYHHPSRPCSWSLQSRPTNTTSSCRFLCLKRLLVGGAKGVVNGDWIIRQRGSRLACGLTCRKWVWDYFAAFMMMEEESLSRALSIISLCCRSTCHQSSHNTTKLCFQYTLALGHSGH
jgi:hypothetical protein